MRFSHMAVIPAAATRRFAVVFASAFLASRQGHMDKRQVLEHLAYLVVPFAFSLSSHTPCQEWVVVHVLARLYFKALIKLVDSPDRSSGQAPQRTRPRNWRVSPQQCDRRKRICAAVGYFARWVVHVADNARAAALVLCRLGDGLGLLEVEGHSPGTRSSGTAAWPIPCTHCLNGEIIRGSARSLRPFLHAGCSIGNMGVSP